MTKSEEKQYLEEMLNNPVANDSASSSTQPTTATDPEVQDLVERQTVAAIERGDVESSDRVIEREHIVDDPETGGRTVEKQTVVIPSAARLRIAQIARARRTLYYIASVITVFLLLRFLLHLFAANPDNGFASFIYGVSGPFHYPFRDLFGTEPDLLQMAFETSSLFAIGIYWLFAYLAVKGISVFTRRSRTQEVATS